MSLAMSSCRKEVVERSLEGEEIIFTAGNAYTDTKASYSGERNSTGSVERIDWELGDQIRIYCDELAVKSGDYAVSELMGEDPTDAMKSRARIKALGEVPLQWGPATDHHFYAVYPSPNYGGSSAAKSIGKDGGSVKVSASIPASQPYRGSVQADGVKYTAAPNLRNMVMTAKAEGTYTTESEIPGRDEIFLSFTPLSTAIQFTITNQTKEPLVLESVSLISASKALNGAFTVDIDNATTPGNITVGSTTISYGREYPACTRSTTVSEAEKTVTIPFDGGVTLPYDSDKSQYGSLTFTFFLQPCDTISDLSFKLVKTDGSWLSTKLSYANGRGLMFPRHKKSEVTGLLIPEGAIWTVKYDPEIVPWGDEDHGVITPDPEFDPEVLVTSWEVGLDNIPTTMTKYNYTLGITGETNFGHAGTEIGTAGADVPVDLTVSSQRLLGSNPPSAVVWYMEYLDESDNTWKLVKSGVPMNGLVTLTASGLDSENGELLSKGDKTISLSVAAASGTDVVPSQSHTARLASSSFGTESAPYDLSMHTIYGDERQKAKTANCYIVRGQGWYAFPLVYGNAIDDNVAPAGFINVNAYNPGGETDPTVNILTRFRNYKGQGIRQPYIEDDLAIIPVSEGSPVLKVSSVDVLWKDASFIEQCQIVGTDATSGKGLTANPCGYVMFKVNGNICQGNAVIAVKDQHGAIVWSWHIWISDDEMDLVNYRNYGGQTVKMLPVNLGWVDSNNESFTYYRGKSVQLRIVQEGSNMVKEFTIVRRPETTAPHEAGTSTYYQWGRKDPFRSVPSSVVISSSDTDIAYSIQNPGTFVKGGNSYYNESISSTAASYYNLWSALNKASGTSAASYNSTTIKTIYDPCPPGFQIPHGTAYTGFTLTGDNVTGSANCNVSGSFGGGWYFTTGAGDESNFFPAGGYVVYSSGAVDKTVTNGYYWTSVPKTVSATQTKAYGMNFSADAVNVLSESNQGDGFSVRPVMEEFL